MRNPRTRLLGSILLLAQAPFAAAGAIINGAFDTDLAGWSTVITNGVVTWDGGRAQLSTGSGTDPFSAVLVQGDDGFFTFPSPINLTDDDLWFRFDTVFADLGIDASEDTPSGFFDQLNVWIYDADSTTQWLAGTFSLLDPGGAGLSFNLSAPADLRGRQVAFSFELTDENDGHDSRVTIDNVRIEQRAAVPEPGTLALILGGLLGVGFRRRNRRGC